MNQLDKNWYFTQRNNKINPCGACNVTSCIMALIQAGWCKTVLDLSDKQQPEDMLYKHIMSSKYVKEKIKKYLYPEYYSYYINNPMLLPQLISALYFGVNSWIGENIVNMHIGYPDYNYVTTNNIIGFLNAGKAVVVSGKFAGLDHFVCLGGYSKTMFIINDPYGNYHTEYQDENGYNVEMTKQEFRDIVNNRFTDKTKIALVFSRKF